MAQASTIPKKKYPVAQAYSLARALVEELAPYCERIEVAGSIRRRAAQVGDIELLCIPKVEQRTLDLFSEVTASDDRLDGKLQEMISAGILEKRGGYGTENKFLRHIESGIPIDIFSTSADHWGMAFLVRTGPAQWNVRVMSALKELGHEGHAYGRAKYVGVEKPSSITLHRSNWQRQLEIMCPTEEDVFKVLGWRYVEPEARA